MQNIYLFHSLISALFEIMLPGVSKSFIKEGGPGVVLWVIIDWGFSVSGESSSDSFDSVWSAPTFGKRGWLVRLLELWPETTCWYIFSGERGWGLPAMWFNPFSVSSTTLGLIGFSSLFRNNCWILLFWLSDLKEGDWLLFVTCSRAELCSEFFRLKMDTRM